MYSLLRVLPKVNHVAVRVTAVSTTCTPDVQTYLLLEMISLFIIRYRLDYKKMLSQGEALEGEADDRRRVSRGGHWTTSEVWQWVLHNMFRWLLHLANGNCGKLKFLRDWAMSQSKRVFTHTDDVYISERSIFMQLFSKHYIEEQQSLLSGKRTFMFAAASNWDLLSSSFVEPV